MHSSSKHFFCDSESWEVYPLVVGDPLSLQSTFQEVWQLPIKWLFHLNSVASWNFIQLVWRSWYVHHLPPFIYFILSPNAMVCHFLNCLNISQCQQQLITNSPALQSRRQTKEIIISCGRTALSFSSGFSLWSDLPVSQTYLCLYTDLKHKANY